MVRNKLEKIKVLVCDDEKIMGRLISAVLTTFGFQSITVATSGRKAIELLKKEPFDFVISDWRMNELDGIDIINFIRKSADSPCPHIPIILLTGNTEAHYVLAARDAGVNEYLIKPFTADQLAKRIRSIIERPRAFVKTATFAGPERRHHEAPPPDGVNKRKRKDK